MIDIIDLDKYLDLKKHIECLCEELEELELQIKDLGYASLEIDDMPKSTFKSDKMDKLINLMESKSEREYIIKQLKKEMDEELISLKSYCKSFKSKFKQKAYKLKYIDGLTYSEICTKLKKSYWAIIKLFNRP